MRQTALRPMRTEALRLIVLLAGLLASGGSLHADAPAPFLWEVRGAQATHYLLGSVHLLPEAADELPDGIADAYDAVDGLVFESDIGELGSAKSGLSLLSSARTSRDLASDLDAATAARLRARIAKLGMSPVLCGQYKAWFCALSLEIYAYQKEGFKGEHGLDQQLHTLARIDNKHITWFESPAAHLALFSNMDETVSRQLLEAELSPNGSTPDDPATMYRAWRENDTGKVEAIAAELKAQYPRVYEHLLGARNRAWLPQLKKLLDGSEPQMVVVGAAHWLGPDGLLAQLRAAGYKPRPYVPTPAGQITAMPQLPMLITATSLAGAMAPGG